MYILGLWDGHDAGAALLEDNKIVFAANEERFSKKKLDMWFPYHSIRAALSFANIKPTDVKLIAFPTTELTKTLERIYPYSKEYYYLYRRRKMLKPYFNDFRHWLKYSMTSLGVWPLCGTVSKAIIARQLNSMGFRNYKLYSVDHHTSHAATAAFTSGFKKGLIITLDGLGDGLSGSISLFENGKLKREHAIPTRHSLGLFYEQITNIVGMRELEDEGKVMAMADYSYPFKFEDNKFKHFFTVEGADIKAKYSPVRQYGILDRIGWQMPREQFAYMAQQLAEETLVKFVGNAIEKYGVGNVAMAGGIFSNVKANMLIKDMNNLKDWFVFPHMGDGGIALGAAMYVNYVQNGVNSYAFPDAYLGPEFDENQIMEAMKKTKGIEYERDKKKNSHAGELINDDHYVFWYQGRMEYGPRALGNRSILAKAGSEEVKEKLNIFVKQREWYQPFAPAILKQDAPRLLEDLKGDGKYMTMVYKVKEKTKDQMRSVMHIDLTARPQIVGEENENYSDVMRRVRKDSGYGVILNTSFNIHGMPIVLSPEDALETMKKTRTEHMFLGDFYVHNKEV